MGEGRRTRHTLSFSSLWILGSLSGDSTGTPPPMESPAASPEGGGGLTWVPERGTL